jgi:hypothetical protein
VSHSALDMSVDARADLATLSPQLLKARATGRLVLAGKIQGTVGAPSFEGRAALHSVAFKGPSLPMSLRQIDGVIEAHGKELSTTGLTLELSPHGRVVIGTPREPARVALLSLDPLDIGQVMLGVRGTDLTTTRPIRGVSAQDLDFQMRLQRTGPNDFAVGGDVWIKDARYAPKEVRARVEGGLASMNRLAKRVMPRLTLDIGIHTRNGAIEVAVPHLPDVDVTIDCRIQGDSRAPRWTGRARGKGVYSRVAFSIYDLFNPIDLGRCGAKD